jgi:hypothetical protein
MVRRLPIGLIAAFLVGFLLVGLPQWSESRVGLDDPAMVAGLAGLAVIAMMLIVGQMAPPARSWAVMTLCLPVAGAARIAASADPAAPGVWLIEIGVALAVGGAAVAPGILAGQLVHRLQGLARAD